MAGILRGQTLYDRSVAGIKLIDGTIGSTQLGSTSVTVPKLAQDVLDLINQSGGGVVVEDNLSSTSSAAALSANQGRVLKNLVDGKQATLVSGTNIKTINGQSLLGDGNLEITSGGSLTVEDLLTSTSPTNALSANQGRVLDEKISSKQNALVSGTTIKTFNGQSLLGSGNIAYAPESLDRAGGYVGGQFRLYDQYNASYVRNVTANATLDDQTPSYNGANICNILFRNTGSSAVTITIPTASPFICNQDPSFTLQPSNYAEVSIKAYGTLRYVTYHY